MVVESISPRSTKRTMDKGDFAAKLGLYYTLAVSRSPFWGASRSTGSPSPAPLPLPLQGAAREQIVGRLFMR